MSKIRNFLNEISQMAPVTVGVDHSVSLDGQAVVAADGSMRGVLSIPAAGPPPEFAIDGAAIKITSGRLGAWTEVWAVSDALRTRLNELTTELADAVNGIHNSDRNPDGDSFDFAGERCDWDFFVGSTAADIAVNPLIYDPTNPMSMDSGRLAAAATRHDDGPPPIPNSGDGTRALQIAQLATTVRANLNGQTFAAFHATGQSMLGGIIQTERALAEDGSAIMDSLTNALQADTGVNMDEELMDMLSTQRAFQAAGRLMQTIDEMMVTIVQLK
jgi:flagellar hook-associated protein 1 FlgK